jgi:DNA/RNA-binding domain of Phe-tRNA-synthetase-like protein
MGSDPDDSRRAFVVKFKIDPAIFATFPGLHIGVVCAKGVDNQGDCPDLLEKIKKIQREIRDSFDMETLADCPKIQNWRYAYTLFGAKPKKHRSSVESLYRMTLEGKELHPINKVVDIYNYLSLSHMVPVGGDDLAKVQGDIELGFARGDEPFLPLGSYEVQRAKEGEVIYADEREVLCRRWNWRESEKSKMTERTRDVLLVSEGLPPVTAEDMKRIVDDLAQLVAKYCGGKISRDILSAERDEWELQSLLATGSLKIP